MEIWMGVAHGLAYIVLGMLGYWLASVSGRVSRLEDRQQSLETDMVSYKGDIRVANERLEAIKSTLEGHIYREEHETWVKIDVLAREISEVRVNMATIVSELKSIGIATRQALEHSMTHDKEAESWKSRIVALEAKQGATQTYGT